MRVSLRFPLPKGIPLKLLLTLICGYTLQDLLVLLKGFSHLESEEVSSETWSIGTSLRNIDPFTCYFPLEMKMVRKGVPHNWQHFDGNLTDQSFGGARLEYHRREQVWRISSPTGDRVVPQNCYRYNCGAWRSAIPTGIGPFTGWQREFYRNFMVFTVFHQLFVQEIHGIPCFHQWPWDPSHS